MGVPAARRRDRRAACRPAVRRVHAPVPDGVHGHLDPPLRLVPGLLGGPARRPALHQVRRERGGRPALRGRAGPAAGQRHRGRGRQGPGRLAAQARALRGAAVRAARQCQGPAAATARAAGRRQFPAAGPQDPQGAGVPLDPGQASRALFLHVHRQARLPRRRGRVPLLLLPRVVRAERRVTPGRGPSPRGGGRQRGTT